MSENMRVYEQVRAVQPEALKPIQGGRLKGMSDINPMWRIKMLTELFGICGIGWKIEITDKRLEQGHGSEVVCFVDINLYVKVDGEWSAPIPGMGGSAFTTAERNGVFTSDECFKMAYTDAISVACKSLGFAADVYFEKDRTKYTHDGDQATPTGAPQASQGQPSGQQQQQSRQSSGAATGRSSSPDKVSENQLRFIGKLRNDKKLSEDDYREVLMAKFGIQSASDLSKKQAMEFINYLQAAG